MRKLKCIVLIGCLFHQTKRFLYFNLVQNPCVDVPTCMSSIIQSCNVPSLCTTSDAQPRPAGQRCCTHDRDCINARWGHTKTSRSRPNSSHSHVRQTPPVVLTHINSELPAPSHLRIQRQLCTHHTPHRAALLHPLIAFAYKHRRVAQKQAAAEQTAHARGKSSCHAQFGNCQRRHTCKPSGSCAHSMQLTGQRRCTHASFSCTNAVGPHENKPRQSKQLMHAARASVGLNSAVASAATPANPVAAVHTARAPLSSAAAPTQRNRA